MGHNAAHNSSFPSHQQPNGNANTNNNVSEVGEGSSASFGNSAANDTQTVPSDATYGASPSYQNTPQRNRVVETMTTTLMTMQNSAVARSSDDDEAHGLVANNSGSRSVSSVNTATVSALNPASLSAQSSRQPSAGGTVTTAPCSASHGAANTLFDAAGATASSERLHHFVVVAVGRLVLRCYWPPNRNRQHHRRADEGHSTTKEMESYFHSSSFHQNPSFDVDEEVNHRLLRSVRPFHRLQRR